MSFTGKQQDDSESSEFEGLVYKQSSPTFRNRKIHHHHSTGTTTTNHDTPSPLLSPTMSTIRRPSIPTIPSISVRPLPRKWWHFTPQGKIIIVLLIAMLMLIMRRQPMEEEIAHTGGGIRSSGTTNHFQGVGFWNPGKTLEVKTLYETPFARFQIHKVKAGTTVINDWLWCDEMDHINVLVQEAGTGKFVIFRQTKYGIPGDPTLAVIGGMVEPGEEPLEAARRELLEELQMESTDWTSMGHYRAAVNRGGGYTYTFLAKNAVAVAKDKEFEVKGQTDMERQEVVKCTQEELLQYALDGK